MCKVFIHISKNKRVRTLNYEHILQKLNPTNVSNKLIKKDRLVVGVSAFNKGVKFTENYLALGAFFEFNISNTYFGASIPDGVEAMIRYNEKGDCEVLTNKLASRTLWYYFDEKELIVSTSQRAIINILGNYEYNELAASWLISAGNTGPGLSWDKRIKHIDYSEVVNLDFESWNLKTRKVHDVIISNEYNTNALDFEKILTDSLSKITLPETKNIITLSGGYDSRFVMEMIKKNGIHIDAMTWGNQSSLLDKDTDGYIAQEVAKRRKVNFFFFDTAWNENDSFDEFMVKFITAGEARIDHLSNYMDNFRMWDQISENGYELVVRSDEVFGWVPVADERNVRLLLEMCYINDYDNFKSLKEYGMPSFEIPERYLKGEDETLYSWRDRLFNIYRQTFVQAALHDLFYPYVEMVNPLFSDSVINAARKLNDKERTSKALYIKAISKYVDYMPTASRSSYPSRENALKSKWAVDYLNDRLNEPAAFSVASDEFLRYVKSNLKVNEYLSNKNTSKLRTMVAGILPGSLKNLLRKNYRKFDLDYNLVAFRIAMIMKWNEIINNDLLNEN